MLTISGSPSVFLVYQFQYIAGLSRRLDGKDIGSVGRGHIIYQLRCPLFLDGGDQFSPVDKTLFPAIYFIRR